MILGLNSVSPFRLYFGIVGVEVRCEEFRLARFASLASSDVIYGRAGAGEGVLGIRIDARLSVNDLRSEGKARLKS